MLKSLLAIAHVASVFSHLVLCKGSQGEQLSDITQEVRLGLFEKGFDVQLRRKRLLLETVERHSKFSVWDFGKWSL